MKRQIIVDSCVDFNEKVYERLSGILRIPFKISIGGEEIVDNNVDTSVLLSKMKADIGKISTSCPSPYDFYEKFKKDAVNFVVTISSKLSGSYQSAVTAKQMLEDEGCKNQVYVLDSKTASAGQSLIVLKLSGLLEQGLSNEQIVDKVNEYSSGLETLFLPNSTENLERNGRISGWKASVSKALKIIPILGANGNGEIVMKSRAIGEKQAETKLINIIASTAKDIEKSTLAITFVDIKEKAEKMRETIRNSIPFKDIKIFRAGGLSTVYADRGGLVFAY
ncbi:MAG TPA: DegV family protein [Ruminococcaceae bacterium]|nr:DegV family protein [Oscillospiraceae bacterium]HCM23657.1 DegV family protein [Oscillospiraceae bacterium]